MAASSHDPDRVYTAFPGFREDDFRADLFPAADAGDSWQSITANLPGESVNVIAEDPDAPGVLYVGTDLGVYVSLGDAGAWHSLSARLPTIPVHDLELHAGERELIIGTHGAASSYWSCSRVSKPAGAETLPGDRKSPRIDFYRSPDVDGLVW